MVLRGAQDSGVHAVECAFSILAREFTFFRATLDVVPRAWELTADAGLALGLEVLSCPDPQSPLNAGWGFRVQGSRFTLNP